jgi:LPPG:FO 2-phospho-L-lactate transferase
MDQSTTERPKGAKVLVVLAGGVGGSKFLWGLTRELEAKAVTAVVNTGDDLELHGLSISPDLDIVTYTLAGRAHPAQGWGFAGDTFQCLELLGRYGLPVWFKLGDQDLATHIFRTQALKSGMKLTAVTEAIRRALGVETRILPMSDDPVRTHVLVGEGAGVQSIHFQDYLVRRQATDEVRGLEYCGSARATATPEVLEALKTARAIILAPSNPLASLGPILAVPGLREQIVSRPIPLVAVSPIVGGRSLKGPSDKFLRWAGVEVSPTGVARFFRSLLGRLDGLLIDAADADQRGAIEALGTRVQVGATIMPGPEEKRVVARATLALLEEVGCPVPRS